MRQFAARIRRARLERSLFFLCAIMLAQRTARSRATDTLYFRGLTPAFAERVLPRESESTMTRALLLATALSIALPAAAAEKGDAAAGKLKVYTCAGCHGITGWKNPYPNYHVPKIGGQNYDYLVAALTAYKKGERSHPTMRAQGESLSEEDIRDIATYLSGLAQ